MSVICKQCGQELIGVVNRCWNCNTKIPVIASQPPTKPPIRRPPVDLAGFSEAAQTASTSRRSPRGLFNVKLSNKAMVICAHASLWVGGFGCLIGLRSAWCFLPAVIGITLGVLGMKATRRDLAATGLVISVLALFLVFAQIGLDQYAKYQSQQMLQSFEEQDF